MKTRISAAFGVVFAAALSVISVMPAFAGPTIVSPTNGTVFCALHPEQRDFLAMDRAQRRAKFLDEEWRAHMAKKVPKFPQALKLEWKDGAPPYSVTVKCGIETVFATNLTATSVDVYNLEIARDFSWCVTDAAKASATGRFSTLDLAPRVMYVPNVRNIRDLGGRIGLDGRRVKQGLVYRSAGLNSNAHTFYSASEILAMYDAGTLEKNFGEQGRKVKKQIDHDKGKFKFDPKAPFLRKSIIKKEHPGKTQMTAEGLRIANEELKWRSDIDLRRDIECWGMTGSPAGEKVKWWHYPSSAYSGIASHKHKEAFKKVFRVFLDEANYPIDFHCIGGADRAGSLAFILNALLGVSDDELDKDWEFTCFNYESQDFGHKSRFDKLRAVVDTYPGATTREKVEAYVKEQGFTDSDIAKFRSIMLEGEKLPPLPEGAFTYVVIPDTQLYRGEGVHVKKGRPQQTGPTRNPAFESRVDWIAANIEKEKIVFVSHVGDIVDWKNEQQWALASSFMARLDGKVPYGISPGNHDIAISDTTDFNKWFPRSRYDKSPWYVGGFDGYVNADGQKVCAGNSDSCQLFEAGGMKFVVLHLECNAPAPVLKWADSMLDKYADRKAIICTHMYLGYRTKEIDKIRRKSKERPDDWFGVMDWSKCHRKEGVSATQAWETCFSKHKNLILIVSGDQSPAICWRETQKGVNGNTVYSTLQDYPRTADDQDWLRLYRFRPADKKIDVWTYSPQHDEVCQGVSFRKGRDWHVFTLQLD